MSHGMLQAARSWSTAWLAVGDALSLPLRDATFDVVLAMHMLYYVPDRVSGLREMRRVCRPDGVTLVLTNAEAHLHELKEVVRAATELDLPSSMIAFKLENGEPELRQVYDDVERHDAASELVITEVEPVLDYVRSMRGFVERAGNERLLARIGRQVADHIERHGAFRVTTHVGCFVCRGAVRPSGAV
jgi:SAM-dependent methyltransferase